MRRVVVTIDAHASVVRGWAGCELVERITGRPPMWLPITGGWSVSERTAREVIALADAEGFMVLLTAPPEAAEPTPAVEEPAIDDEPQAALW